MAPAFVPSQFTQYLAAAMSSREAQGVPLDGLQARNDELLMRLLALLQSPSPVPLQMALATQESARAVALPSSIAPTDACSSSSAPPAPVDLHQQLDGWLPADSGNAEQHAISVDAAQICAAEVSVVVSAPSLDTTPNPVKPSTASHSAEQDFLEKAALVKKAPDIGHQDLKALAASQQERAGALQSFISAPGMSSVGNAVVAGGDVVGGLSKVFGSVGSAFLNYNRTGAVAGFDRYCAFYSPGMVGFGPSFFNDAGNLAGSLNLFGYTGWVGPGGSISFTDSAGNLASAGFFAYISADSKVWIEYPNATGIAAANDKAADKLGRGQTCRAHLLKSLAVAGTLSGGYRPGIVGFGGRFTIGRNSRVNYVTDVNRQQVYELLKYKNRKGVVFFRDLAVAANIRKFPIEIPNLEKPHELKVGDELTVEVAGTVDVGVVLDAGLRTGVAVTIKGDFELSARKLDENKVMLVVSPKEGVDVTWDAQIPLLARVFASRGKAQSLRQEFVFDLSNAEGEKAYQQALKGHLPTALEGITATNREADVKALAYYWGEAQKLAPRGVKRGWYEVVTQPRRDTIGAEIGIAGLPWLAAYKSSTVEERFVTNGQATHHTRTLRGETETLAGKSKKQTEFTATLALATVVNDDNEFVRRYDGLVLEQTFKFSKATQVERTSLAKLLREDFGVNIRDFEPGIEDGPYELVIQRTFDSNEVNALDAKGDKITQAAREAHTEAKHLRAFLEQVCNVPTPSERIEHAADVAKQRSALIATAKARGLSDSDQTALCEAIEAPVELEHRPAFESLLAYDRAYILQEYAFTTGVNGMAALHRYVSAHNQGNDRKIAVRVGTGPFDDLAQKVSELMADYAEPVSLHTNEKHLNERLRRVKEQQRTVERLMRELGGDVIRRTFDPAQTERLEQMCISLSQSLREMLQLDGELNPVQRSEVLNKIKEPDVLQLGELLTTHYNDLLRADEPAKHVRERFVRVEAALKNLGAERSKLERDVVADRYEKAVRARKIAQIDLAIEQLKDIIGVAHLSSEQRRTLKASLKSQTLLRSADRCMAVI